MWCGIIVASVLAVLATLMYFACESDSWSITKKGKCIGRFVLLACSVGLIGFCGWKGNGCDMGEETANARSNALLDEIHHATLQPLDVGNRCGNGSYLVLAHRRGREGRTDARIVFVVPTDQGPVRVGIDAQKVVTITQRNITGAPIIASVSRDESWGWGGTDEEINLQRAIDYRVTSLVIHCPPGGCNIVTCGAMP